MSFTVADIAKHLGGEVAGDSSVTLTGFAPAEHAKPGDLTFAENQEYFARAEQSAASAVIVSADIKSGSKVLIRVPNARVAFAKVLPLFFPEPKFEPGIHPTAVIAKTAVVDKLAHIGPQCVVGERVRIEARVVLQAGNFVGDDCAIGEDSQLFPNVTLYPRTQLGRRVRIHSGTVVGSDGFGYVVDAGAHRKVPQIGNVIIDDDVEIGACVAIDRGALGATRIGKGTKIDNLVQIAHNVVIGEHCIVVGQAGIAGSTTLGNYVVLAGQVGLAGHIKIGDHVTIAAQSGVMSDITGGGTWLGAPAVPDKQAKRQMLAIQHLPEALRRLRNVEKKLGIERKSKGEQ
jgi:UDP-3-O-[3-hydroxymyristoyl] glucosamine N-acyltransferase